MVTTFFGTALSVGLESPPGKKNKTKQEKTKQTKNNNKNRSWIEDIHLKINLSSSIPFRQHQHHPTPALPHIFSSEGTFDSHWWCTPYDSWKNTHLPALGSWGPDSALQESYLWVHAADAWTGPPLSDPFSATETSWWANAWLWGGFPLIIEFPLHNSLSHQDKAELWGWKS